MVKEIGHASFLRRIAFMVGGGFTPGVNALITGAGLAANKWGWDLVGIRDGFAGLLFPERYPDGGLVSLNPQLFENLDPAAVPGVLVAGHAPFAWGEDAAGSVVNAVALEAVAQMAFGTLSLDQNAPVLESYVLEKHHRRKHGPDAYYGQK